MENEKLGGLGFSDTPPTNLKPLWLQYPARNTSYKHQVNCLAWFLATHKTKKEIESFLKTQKPKTQDEIRPALVRCEAFIWYRDRTAEDIRKALLYLPNSESKALSAALNEYRELHRNHMDGNTYE